MTNDRANCQIKKENICFDEPDGRQECREVPKTVCYITSDKKSNSLPETEVWKKSSVIYSEGKGTVWLPKAIATIYLISTKSFKAPLMMN